MGGFSAITSANGWLIAALGISVVFFGLVSLALAISYFPRMIGWWNLHTSESPVVRIKKILVRQPKPVSVPALNERQKPDKVDDAEASLRLLTDHMGESFKLPRLLDLAEHRGLAKPHSTIARLLLRGTLVGGSDGLFRWSRSSKEEGYN
jgi:hypothetical protein